MTSQPETRPAPNLQFSHMGLSVKNLERMEAFYGGRDESGVSVARSLHPSSNCARHRSPRKNAANHGVAWSIYAHDPEGNNLEFFVDTPWYIKQPFLIPLDLSKSDVEIARETKALCESSAGFEPLGDWRQKVATRMTPFVSNPAY